MQNVISLRTSKKEEILDITEDVQNIVSKSNIRNGLCMIYAKHATAAVIINENYDPNVCVDILNCLNKLIPDGKWLHDRIDNNAAAHIKSAFLGPSEVVPIKDGKLQLGTWQSIMLCDFDGPRNREVVVQIIKDEQKAA
jgi:secondary thiamine-phosphate synthase enzyme